MLHRRKSKELKIGDVFIGGNHSVKVQSMLNVPAHDIEGNVAQAIALEKAGCQIIRVAVPDMQTIETVKALKAAIKIPVVVDIHFNHKLALASIDAGADKVRINPGNIGSDENVRLVAQKCKEFGVPIRIGVNSGSVQKEILEKYGAPTAEALAESAMCHVNILRKHDFDDMAISIKSSDVAVMIRAYEIVAEQCDYPLHLGVTEAGTERMGLIKSSIGIGSLLTRGIGDTIRVSLTADPVKEIAAGNDILKAVGLKTDCASLVSCPTCGRTKINLIALANEVEERLASVNKNIKVAVMGCIVNGPGEAKEADIGIAGGNGEGLIFKKGEVLRKVPEDKIVEELMLEIEKM